MGISPQSFAATDIVIVAGLVQPKGVQRKTRRVVQVAELLKDAKDPGRFQDLLKYDYDADSLIETREFSYHSERISSIAHSWDMTVEEAIQNIKARAKMKEIIVRTAVKEKKPYLLKAGWVVKANAKFEEIINRYAKKKKLDHRSVVKDWKTWLKKKTMVC